MEKLEVCIRPPPPPKKKMESTLLETNIFQEKAVLEG